MRASDLSCDKGRDSGACTEGTCGAAVASE